MRLSKISYIFFILNQEKPSEIKKLTDMQKIFLELLCDPECAEIHQKVKCF